MKINIYTDGRKPRKDGMMNVYVRVVHNSGKSFLVSTGLTCMSAPINCNFPPDEPNGKAKSFRLMKIYTDCMDFVYHNDDMPVDRLKEELTAIVTGKEKGKMTIPEMFDKFCEGKYEGTKKLYQSTKNKITQFDKSADFSTVNTKWLDRFSRWLADSGLMQNGISIHLRNLRAVFNFAIDEGITTNYPFRKFKIRQQQTRKRDLTLEQVRLLRGFPCPSFQKRYVDIFMLMFYLCGINAGDLFLLKHDNVRNGRIEYYRQKTKKYYSIKIEPEAQTILNKYKGEKYLLCFMDTNTDYHQPLKRLNQQLKKIGMQYNEGGKWSGEPLFPELSSYYARHTWASIAAEVDIPMDVIAQALGHSSPYSTTDIYVNRRLKKIDEANRKVIDFVNGQ